MTKDELNKALAEYKQATQEKIRLISAYNQARNEDSALMQAEKEAEELDAKYRKAYEVWRDLSNKFNKEHKPLVKAVEAAQQAWSAATHNIDFIFYRNTGVDNEW